MQKRLGNYVRSERKNLGLSQTELATLCGVDNSIISKIESNQYIPSITVAFSLELVFQKPLGDVFPHVLAQARENLFESLIQVTGQLETKDDREWTQQQLEERARHLASINHDD